MGRRSGVEELEAVRAVVDADVIDERLVEVAEERGRGWGGSFRGRRRAEGETAKGAGGE